MTLPPDTLIFIGLDGIATIEHTDGRDWLIVERFYLPNGKRIGCMEFPPEPSIDAQVEKAIALGGCDCHIHNMQYLCCRKEEYEAMRTEDDALINSDDLDEMDPDWDVSL